MEAISSCSSEYREWSWDISWLAWISGHIQCYHVSFEQSSFSNCKAPEEIQRHSCYTWACEIKTLADELSLLLHGSLLGKCNILADSPEAYYRRNLKIPSLDHIVTQLTDRFEPIQQTQVKLIGLIPSFAVTYSPASVTEVGELYKADLPSPQLLSTTFRRWKAKYSSAPLDTRPNTLEQALQSCDRRFSKHFYHSLYITSNHMWEVIVSLIVSLSCWKRTFVPPWLSINQSTPRHRIRYRLWQTCSRLR